MKNHIAAAGLMVTAAFLAGNAQATFVGNPLYYPTEPSLANASSGGADSSAPFVILGEYNPSSPSATSTLTLPTGTVQDVDFYGASYNFTLYVLSPATAGPKANEQTFTVLASQTFSGSAAAGIQTLTVSGMSVSAGDLLAFAGVGPYYPQNPNDAVGSDATYSDPSALPGSFTATPPGGPPASLTVGVSGDLSATYDYVDDVFGNQGRAYAIGVDVSPVPEPTTMVAGALLLLPLGASAFRLLRKRQAA